jgi:hypothetical protein
VGERPNWRKSYHETYCDTVDEFRWCRRNNPDRRIECGFHTYRAGDLTDTQISDIAWRWAERDINRAIRQHNSKV